MAAQDCRARLRAANCREDASPILPKVVGDADHRRLQLPHRGLGMMTPEQFAASESGKRVRATSLT